MAKKGGEDVSQREHVDRKGTLEDEEAILDFAEELFVSCRFTEAVRVCGNALARYRCPDGTRRTTSSTPPAGTFSARAVAFEDMLIEPSGACDTYDLLVAVLLQCGFELGRLEEWSRCRTFYELRGAMPFATGMLWLRLRLAGGEVDLVRGVLCSLRSELGKELQRLSLSRDDPSEIKERTLQEKHGHYAAAHANYCEATETLVAQVMLPGGDAADALSLVASDPHLGPKPSGRLIAMCQASAATTPARQPDAGEGHGSIHDRNSRGRNRGRAQGGSNRHSVAHDRLDTPELGEDTRGRTLAGGHSSDIAWKQWAPESRVRFLVAAGAAGLAAYVACRRRDSLWRAVRSASGLAMRTAGDIGTFIVGAS